MRKETDWAVFGGSGGDTAFTHEGTTYRAYSAYRNGAAGDALIGADTGNARLLTDDAFAGHLPR